jgi:hypothetical protein
MRNRWIVILAGVCLAFTAVAAHASDPSSIQLVGTFNGVTCEPNDPANDMESLGGHVWRMLKFIDEPGSPDTISFKFTRDGSYGDRHWGWSETWGWGIAEYAWSPPSIVKVLDDPGFYYFYFNDADYTYSLERPAGSISGAVTADKIVGVPSGACVTLYDSGGAVIGRCGDFTGDSYRFDALAAMAYSISAHAPGYRDTMIAGIELGVDEAKDVPIHLTEEVGVLIASADCRRVSGGVKLTWCTMDGGGLVSFDVFRGDAPELVSMEKRNISPVTSTRLYEYFDRCEDPTRDVYYYLVECGGTDPTRFGPILAAGVPAASSELGQNYPNPFNPSTTIPFTIGPAGAGQSVTISFFDAAGHLIDRYGLGAKQTGDYTFLWNPSARRRGSFPSGVYYCRLEVGKETHTRKVILLR